MFPGMEALVIADQGKSAYRIVLPADASESQRYAGAELARYIREISGATLGIVTGAGGATGYEIVLGAPPTATTLGDEGYQIRTEGGRILVSGSRVRGTLYGVYGFLSGYLGCRWYTPDKALVPECGRLAIPAMDETWVPGFEYRESYWAEAFDGDWAARNRLNSTAARLEERHGGKTRYAGGFVHTMDALVPVALYAEHPEYFAMRKGKRVRDGSQRCLTNPGVLAVAVENVRKALREYPDATIVSVSQNDNWNFCECPACKAVDEAEGSHAGTNIAFANGVADAIAGPEFQRQLEPGDNRPRVSVDTLAYMYTRSPPKTVKPRHNVIVRLCSFECCFAHALDACSDDSSTLWVKEQESNSSFMRDLDGWSRIAPRLYVWDYVTNHMHFPLQFPNLDVLDRNIRTFAEHGVAGVFEQGQGMPGTASELGELKAWVLARLLADPTLDADALIGEFVTAVYGPAAGPVREFIDLGRRAARESGEHVRIYDGADRAYLAPERLPEYDRLLDRAAALAAGDPVLEARVMRLGIPVWYAMVERTDTPPEMAKPETGIVGVAPEADATPRQRAAGRLLEAILVCGIRRLSVWRGIEKERRRLEAIIAREGSP